jgi:hypothetical protein
MIPSVAFSNKEVMWVLSERISRYKLFRYKTRRAEKMIRSALNTICIIAAEDAVSVLKIMAKMTNPAILSDDKMIVGPRCGINTVIKMLNINPPVIATLPGKR